MDGFLMYQLILPHDEKCFGIDKAEIEAENHYQGALAVCSQKGNSRKSLRNSGESPCI